MRYSVVGLFAWLSLAALVPAGSAAEGQLDFAPWRRLAVQDGGRYKPLDTLAWETLRTLSNRASFADPETGEKLNATAWYLTLIFESPGWGEPGGDGAMGGHHGRQEKADKWDRAELLRVDYLDLRKMLGLADDQKYISPLELSQAKVRDPKTERETSFLLWAARLGREESRGLPPLERKALELAGNYFAYKDLRTGRRMGVLPVRGQEHDQWVTVADLLTTSYADADDPTGALRKAKEQLQKVRTAYMSHSAEAFQAATEELIDTLQEAGPELGAYPSQGTIDLEVAYNRWVPFRFAWVFMMFAFFFVALSMGTSWKPLYTGGAGMFVLGFAAMLVGFGMRMAISGRAPVTNMYESVVYLSLGTALFGLIFELIYRRRYVLTAAAAVSTVGLILADNCPAILDPSLRPLQPVLRSNFWLVTHVMSITLSYAAFALALGVGNITLGYFLVGSKKEEVIAALTRFTYRALQVGVFLLAAGTILGGVWAAYSWGRFWGWDPKEVWALIALLFYLAVLHARFVGWVQELGLAACAVLAFAAVLMAWYGVNFWLGAGLHSYGFGSGGHGYVLAAVLLQSLYVVVAVIAALVKRWSDAE